MPSIPVDVLDASALMYIKSYEKITESRDGKNRQDLCLLCFILLEAENRQILLVT